VNLAYSQSTFQHESEHDFIAFVVDDGKEEFDLLFSGIAWKRVGLAEEMPLRDNGAIDGLFIDDREEIIKQPQGRKPAVDREGRKLF